VLLDSPDRNVERVRMRVAKGGHAVPEAKNSGPSRAIACAAAVVSRASGSGLDVR
jgi:predicted ABC-type ATPase